MANAPTETPPQEPVADPNALTFDNIFDPGEDPGTPSIGVPPETQPPTPTPTPPPPAPEMVEFDHEGTKISIPKSLSDNISQARGFQSQADQLKHQNEALTKALSQQQAQPQLQPQTPEQAPTPPVDPTKLSERITQLDDDLVKQQYNGGALKGIIDDSMQLARFEAEQATKSKYIIPLLQTIQDQQALIQQTSFGTADIRDLQDITEFLQAKGINLDPSAVLAQARHYRQDYVSNGMAEQESRSETTRDSCVFQAILTLQQNGTQTPISPAPTNITTPPGLPKPPGASRLTTPPTEPAPVSPGVSFDTGSTGNINTRLVNSLMKGIVTPLRG